MSNKIDTYGPQPSGPAARVRSAEPGSGGGGERVAGVPAGDRLQLTDDAVLLQQLERAVAETPAVDSRRVAELRRALADGSYRIDAQSIATKLARFEWQLAQT